MTTPVLDAPAPPARADTGAGTGSGSDTGAAGAGLRELHAVIDGLAASLWDADADAALGAGAGCGELVGELVVELDRAIRRLEAVKLSAVARADAAGLPARTGMADTGAWLARRTQTGPARAAGQVHLATALNHGPAHDELNDAPASRAGNVVGSGGDRPVQRPCARALSAGALSVDHARVIINAIDGLPAGLSASKIQTIEESLVGQAARLTPAQLRIAARRALAAVEPDPQAVDAHEDQLLATEEQAALANTRLTLHDNGDGTTTGHFTIPHLAAAILTRALHTLTAPRRTQPRRTQHQTQDQRDQARDQDWAHARGLALTELLEHLPTDHLHPKTAATLIVTIDHHRLQAAVGAAGLDTGHRLSPGETRRLACGAGILPAILNGPSLPLDLGRTSRLFTETQRTALATRHTTCAATGCQRPYAWCELHHQQPWTHGGTTDLNNAIPLCGHHHRHIHNPHYQHHHTPHGITFTRR